MPNDRRRKNHHPYLSISAALIGMAFTLGVSSWHGALSPHSNSSKASPRFENLNQLPKPMSIRRRGNAVTIHMYTEETKVTIAPGVQFPAWTFDGIVPGPVLYLREGDHVTLTLHNLDPRLAHSLDLHAAMVPPNQDFTPVLPGQSKTIHFVASDPGVFVYHCESSPMPLHMAEGMYGAVVVTPAGKNPPLFTVVQSEFYRPNDLHAVLHSRPQYVVFNGMVNRYVINPLSAPVGIPFTIAVVNAGPNDFSAFHVVGSLLRDVQASGNPKNNLYDVQTYTIAPGDAALIHLQLNQPGLYAFVSHAMNQFGKGAHGVLDAKPIPSSTSFTPGG